MITTTEGIGLDVNRKRDGLIRLNVAIPDADGDLFYLTPREAYALALLLLTAAQEET